MNFSDAIRNQSNLKTTENGQLAFKSTGYSKVLDLFAVAGALRTRENYEVETKIADAFSENPLLAIKLAFYTRDVRGGLGERKAGRTMLSWFAKRYPEIMNKNLGYVPEFGRWDDLYTFVGSLCEDAVGRLIREQLREDLINMRASKPISIMAKWLKSINATSLETQKLGRWTAKSLGLSERNYRITLSALRAYLDVLERKMSKKEWEAIAYSKVPSKAMNKYREAFRKNDAERFSQFMTKVEAGEEKINAGTLYPYDITEKYMSTCSRIDRVLEEQWKALPNYVEPGSNVLIMADTSGSMAGRPIATSVGLAVYFAERNVGAYHNMFLTFSARPEFVTLRGESLYEKLRNARNANWDMNTNLGAAFREVLAVAVRNRVPAPEMPKAIVVISDMEIDNCTERSWSFYDQMKAEFASRGYEIPNIVFWNVNARNDTFLVDNNRKGVQLVSGSSVSTFKHLLDMIDCTPYEAMLQVLNSERYAMITA